MDKVIRVLSVHAGSCKYCGRDHLISIVEIEKQTAKGTKYKVEATLCEEEDHVWMSGAQIGKAVEVLAKVLAREMKEDLK